MKKVLVLFLFVLIGNQTRSIASGIEDLGEKFVEVRSNYDIFFSDADYTVNQYNSIINQIKQIAKDAKKLGGEVSSGSEQPSSEEDYMDGDDTSITSFSINSSLRDLLFELSSDGNRIEELKARGITPKPYVALLQETEVPDASSGSE